MSLGSSSSRLALRGLCAFSILFLWCLGALARPPRANDEAEAPVDPGREEARELAVEGIELLEKRQWQAAHERLSRAYALYQAPTVALLDAKALEHLGQLKRALALYEEAANMPVDEDSPPPFRRAVRDALRERDRLSKLIPTMTIVVHNATSSHTLKVNGEPLGRKEWNHPRLVDPGSYRLLVERGGQVELEQTLLVEAGGNSRLVLSLPKSEVPPPAPTPARAAPAPSRTMTFVSLGVGAAGLATGVVAGLVMLDAKSELDERCTSACPADASDTLDRFRTARSISIAGYAAGGVGIGLGLLLLLVEPSEPEPPLSAGVSVGPHGADVALRGVF